MRMFEAILVGESGCGTILFIGQSAAANVNENKLEPLQNDGVVILRDVTTTEASRTCGRCRELISGVQGGGLGLRDGFIEIDIDVVEVVLGVFADELVILVTDFATHLGGNAGP